MFKISEMDEPGRSIATYLHALIKGADPRLTPRTFYNMPFYEKNGSVLLFFRKNLSLKRDMP
ncbi:hypothetical protein [Caldiplasma sukawensis]